MTPIQKLYRNQINRIKRLIRSYIKKGYNITYEIPSYVRPNKRTIERLKSINATDILENSTYTLKTGDVVTGYEARVILRKEAQRNAQLARRMKKAKEQIDVYYRVDIIESIKNRLMDIASRNWAIVSGQGAIPHDFDSDIFPLISLMDDAEGKHGTLEYEQYLQENEYAIISELDKIREEKYLEQLQASFVVLANLLSPRSGDMKTASALSELADLYNLA